MIRKGTTNALTSSFALGVLPWRKLTLSRTYLEVERGALSPNPPNLRGVVSFAHITRRMDRFSYALKRGP